MAEQAVVCRVEHMVAFSYCPPALDAAQMNLCPAVELCSARGFFVNDVSSPWEQRPRRSRFRRDELSYPDHQECSCPRVRIPFGRGILQYIPMAVVGCERPRESLPGTSPNAYLLRIAGRRPEHARRAAGPASLPARQTRGLPSGAANRWAGVPPRRPEPAGDAGHGGVAHWD